MKHLLTFLLLLFYIQYTFGQDSIKSKPFVAINTGAYFPSRNNFKTIYGSAAVFINGVSFGIPVVNKMMHLYGKAMYFKNEGVPLVYHINIKDGQTVRYTTQEGKIAINQFMFNIGLQKYYEFKIHHQISGLIGILFVKYDEEYEDSESSVSEKGLAGYLVGVGYEYKFKSTSLFTEFQYNVDRFTLKTYGISAGGLNINVGAKYHFKGKVPKK